MNRITRMATRRPEPALPPEIPPKPLPPYQPGTVTVGGVEFEAWGGRMPLSQYPGASSLTGTARWGSA